MLKPLVPDLTYNDLMIVDGMVASVEIARLLFVAHKIPPASATSSGRICWHIVSDTWATVCLLRRLRDLAGR